MRTFHTRFLSPIAIAVLLLLTLAACGEQEPGVVQFEARATPEGPSTPTPTLTPTPAPSPTATPTPEPTATPTPAPTDTPTPVPSPSPEPEEPGILTPQPDVSIVTQLETVISAGDRHTCALPPGGTPVCWGSDSVGQAMPIDFLPLSTISSGNNHSCGLTQEGAAICWGGDAFGQINAPTDQTFLALSSGDDFTCALTFDGTPVCWGGQGITPPDGEKFTQISSGGRHACGLRLDGSAVCWGDDADGKLNPPSGTFFTIASGGDHTCALTAQGAPVCWGSDSSGQRTGAPVDAMFLSISSGGSHSCGLRGDGTADCWGDWGGAEVPTDAFFQISCGRNYSCGTVNGIQECAGEVHTCGVTFEGTVVCWGDDSAGQSAPPANLSGSGHPGDGTDGEATSEDGEGLVVGGVVIPLPPPIPGVPPPTS